MQPGAGSRRTSWAIIPAGAPRRILSRQGAAPIGAALLQHFSRRRAWADQIYRLTTGSFLDLAGAYLCMGGLLLTVSATRAPGHGSHRPAAYVLPRPGAAPGRGACPNPGKTTNPRLETTAEGLEAYASVAGRRVDGPPDPGTTDIRFCGCQPRAVVSSKARLAHLAGAVKGFFSFSTYFPFSRYFSAEKIARLSAGLLTDRRARTGLSRAATGGTARPLTGPAWCGKTPGARGRGRKKAGRASGPPKGPARRRSGARSPGRPGTEGGTTEG